MTTQSFTRNGGAFTIFEYCVDTCECPLETYGRQDDSMPCPVAVPGIFVADVAASSSADRCHSLASLYLPQAALGSLPVRIGSANMKTSRKQELII